MGYTDAIIENAVIVVGHDGVVLVLAELGLPCQQAGIAQGIGVSAYEFVVVTSTSHQQQVTQFMPVSIGPAVIEQFAQAAIGHRVAGATGELVKNFLLFQHKHPEMINLLMQVGDTVGLLKICTGG